MMPNDVISFHTVQCLWQLGVTWDSNKVLFFLHLRVDHFYSSILPGFGSFRSLNSTAHIYPLMLEVVCLV